MPHEQSFLSSVLSVWEDQLTVMRLFFSLVHPLLRASGKDKTMKRIPKTPIEFDYDLWISEDGKCMVRVKATGETTEVDREVMKALRNEEKKLRRSYDTGGASDSEELKTREDWNEWQANVLGAAILMPQREIDLAVAYYARGRKLVSYDGTYAYWDKVALDMICQQFGVSKTAAVIRLRQLGHLETRPYSEYNDPLEVWA